MIVLSSTAIYVLFLSGISHSLILSSIAIVGSKRFLKAANKMKTQKEVTSEQVLLDGMLQLTDEYNNIGEYYSITY